MTPKLKSNLLPETERREFKQANEEVFDEVIRSGGKKENGEIMTIIT